MHPFGCRLQLTQMNFICSSWILKIKIISGHYCFCFWHELKRDEEREACSYGFGSWIGNELEVTQSPLVAYLRGATYKVENFVPQDSDIGCGLQGKVHLKIFSSMKPAEGMISY